jgi:hypothetical protein
MTETEFVDSQAGGATGAAIVSSAAVSAAGALRSPAARTHGFRSWYAVAIMFVAVSLTIAIPLLGRHADAAR